MIVLKHEAPRLCRIRRALFGKVAWIDVRGTKRSASVNQSLPSPFSIFRRVSAQIADVVDIGNIHNPRA